MTRQGVDSQTHFLSIYLLCSVVLDHTIKILSKLPTHPAMMCFGSVSLVCCIVYAVISYERSGNVNLRYTLAFLRSGDSVLMLYRYREPNRHFWNGVGGKVHDGETPRDCVIREVAEETGISLDDVRFSGIVTWEEGDAVGGMYVYVAELPEGDSRRYDVPYECSEGMLAWKPVNQVLHSVEVVDNILHFLPPMLAGESSKRWHCRYNQYSLASVEVLEFPELKGV